jgi:hypothetical protein
MLRVHHRGRDEQAEEARMVKEEGNRRSCGNPLHLVEADARHPVNRLDHFDDEQTEEGEPRAEFDPEIAAGEAYAARAALATETEVADDRQVVEDADRLQAGETSRARPDDAFLERQTGHEDVQEGTDHQAEDEDEEAPDDERSLDRHAVRIASAAASGDRLPASRLKSAHSR